MVRLGPLLPRRGAAATGSHMRLPSETGSRARPCHAPRPSPFAGEMAAALVSRPRVHRRALCIVQNQCYISGELGTVWGVFVLGFLFQFPRAPNPRLVSGSLAVQYRWAGPSGWLEGGGSVGHTLSKDRSYRAKVEAGGPASSAVPVVCPVSRDPSASLVFLKKLSSLPFKAPLSPSQVLGLKLPNLLGRAEKVTFQFSYGTKETSYGLSFFKPQPGNFQRK